MSSLPSSPDTPINDVVVQRIERPVARSDDIDPVNLASEATRLSTSASEFVSVDAVGHYRCC